MFDAAAYLNLLGVPSAPASSELLEALHRRHLTEIPYNNIDIVLGRPFDLSEEALFNKIVERRLGGFCYEIAPTFHRLLVSLGFEAVLHSAKVVQPDGDLGPAYDHAVIIVQLEKRWLADVGNSRWSLRPLCLDVTGWQENVGRYFRIEENSGHLAVRERTSEGLDQAQFVIEPGTHTAGEFQEICHWKWTCPESKFVRGLIIGRGVDDERVIINRHRVLRWGGAGIREEAISNIEELRGAILRYFGDKLDCPAFLDQLLEPAVLDKLSL